MDSFSGVTVFVQVAESRSFVTAGRQLGLSASAVSKSIARLEEKLGVRLFHRSTRSMTLTAEGALFLERSRRIIGEMEAAQLELSQVAGKPAGRLRISLPQVSPLLLPVLGDFMARYPDIELDLDFSDRMVEVIEEGFDAVIRTGQPMDSRLSARKLGNFTMKIVASPAYLARYGTPENPGDLLHHRCMHYRFPYSGKLEKWELGSEVELNLPISMVCNNIETRVCFALKGLGIAFLPEFAINNLIAEGQLVTLLDDIDKRRGVFHILWPASKHASPKIRALVDFLSDRVFANGKAESL
ncbi:LysR family transcriptional regulator [Pantoea coffeiphila]|uniref:LysR family transcriptional regulator n=1 Tax=Pantoea coffeiphila TaxID=1465635 RepID=A0A2S9IEP4_9GAMM|nr:LysR family transcriptional regulator [Pantoea coffeiphila]PRD16260.1 LysR family transcriptional regulator [Pantoea coffeiphila]